MPRKSAEQLVADRRFRDATVPIRPREGLPTAVRGLFLDIASSAPADHFRREDSHLLEQFCVAVLQAREAHARLSSEGQVIGGKASPWLVPQEKAVRALTALAMRLRLSPQARLDPKTAARAAGRTPSYYEEQRMNGDEYGDTN